MSKSVKCARRIYSVSSKDLLTAQSKSCLRSYNKENICKLLNMFNGNREIIVRGQ